MEDITMKTLVLYHDDVDGFTAAWIVWRAFDHEIEAVPVNYGQPPPDVTGRDVLIVDFSYPRATLLDMKAKATSLRVFDHHKSAQQDLAGLDFCVFDMDRSGAQLVWDELMGGKRPTLVDHVGDRDLWRFKLPFSREINAWIHCRPQTFEVWTMLAHDIDHDHDNIVVAGRGAVANIEAYVTAMKRYARVVEFCGYHVPVVNAPGPNASEVLGALAEDGYPFAVGYFQRSDGRWQYSLRSRGDFDVAELARFFGGGGHKNAAGFEAGCPVDTLKIDGSLAVWKVAQS